jgi:hypothetical protein
MQDERDQEQGDENVEQQLGEAAEDSGDTAESEQGRNQRNQQENQCPIQHDGVPSFSSRMPKAILRTGVLAEKFRGPESTVPGAFRFSGLESVPELLRGPPRFSLWDADRYRPIGGQPGLRRAVHSAEGNIPVRYALLWLLGIPIPVLILIWLFFGH